MIMSQTTIDRLYRDFQDIIGNLDQLDGSLRVTAEDTFRKNLLLAAASHFESEVKQHIIRLAEKHSASNEMIVAFVRIKAVERQFHTYFQWDRRNANSFFGLFGLGYKSYMVARVNASLTYDEAIQAFLELGRARNQLVHHDFSGFRLERTSEEIFDLYKKACIFVNSLETSFDEYLQSKSETPGSQT